MSKASSKPGWIDFARVAERADLAKLISASQGEPDRSRKWLCPFHDDHNPSLGLTNGGKAFRCWACEASGSALDWLVKIGDATDIVDAARQLDPAIAPRKGPGSPAVRRSAPETAQFPPTPTKRPDARVGDPAWRDGPWQSEVDRAVREAEACLWSKAGRPALDWLRGRGFQDWLISKFRLGFFPSDWRSEPIEILPLDKWARPGRIWLPRGITIPWLAPGAWYGDVYHDTQPLNRWVGLNVRRLHDDVNQPWTENGKYLAAKMSERGYGYPFPDELTPGVNVLVVEGELDGLIAQQFLGHLTTVVTAGGASQAPDPDLVAEMKLKSPRWLIATDADPAGERTADRWRSIGFDRCRRLLLPPGRKDIGDMARAGDDIPGWLRDECRRIGVAV